MTMNSPVLQIENLKLQFNIRNEDPVLAVNGASLEAQMGKITALVGESGSGKSSLALTVMGAMAENAAVLSGKIYLKGEELFSLQPRQRRHLITKHVGVVFQDPFDSLNPLIRIGNQVIEAAQVKLGINRREAKELAVCQLEMMQLPDPKGLMQAYPHMLSGGMCQRVMIAMAMIGNPSLLIADEPTTALDVSVQMQILRLMQNLVINHQISLLIITHDLGIVAEIADDVYVMKDGCIVESGTVYDIFERPHHEYTRSLLDANL